MRVCAILIHINRENETYMAKKAGNLFTTAYLLIMFTIYPFYVEKGYLNIGEAKFRFFKYVSLAAFFILLIIALLCGMKRLKGYLRGEITYLINWERISAGDLFILLYATAVFLSFTFSDYKKEALWGAEGWYIGCVPLILLCGLYFLVSRLWNGNFRIIGSGLIAASSLVFLLGICNRFSFYPVAFAGSEPGFISTLGNINWYCGYLAVVAPVGISLFIISEDRKRIWLGVYAVLAFTAGFSQGSSSVFLWFFALFFFLLWISLEKKRRLTEWFFLIFLWGISAQLVRALRLLMPKRYQYDTDNLCGYFTGSGLSLWIALAALVMFLWSRYGSAAKKQFYKAKDKRQAISCKNTARKLLLSGTVIMLAFWAVLAGLNTKWGLPYLKGNSFFTFGSDWGNGRGASVLVGIKAFGEMSFLKKIFGVGPDCFAAYVYSVPALQVILRENFGSARLTNAHCELLTGLVNTGLFGAGMYLGIFVSFLKGLLEKRERYFVKIPFLAGIFCYLIHNMVSFAQVLNLPFLFLLMALCRKTEEADIRYSENESGFDIGKTQ